MAFDADKQKAVRRRTIPAPMAMQFNGSCGYDEILKIGKETFSPDFDDSPLESFSLSDAGGILYCIQDKAAWTLSKFVKELGIAPSKLRLYIVYRPEVSFVANSLVSQHVHYIITHSAELAIQQHFCIDHISSEA